MASLVGKHVLITGASSGIGTAAARAFAQAGADVALLARSSDGLERVAGEVRARGSRALVIAADVTDQGAMDAAVARTEAELGWLDVLVSNHAATVWEGVGTGEPRGTGRGRPSLTLPVRLALPSLRLPGR